MGEQNTADFSNSQRIFFLPNGSSSSKADPGFINGQTKIFGIFGDPVEHTLSPAMHNAAFREKGLNCCYLPFRVLKEALPAAVKAIVALGLKGVNVTAPHKETVIPYLDEFSAEARFLQAVNTIENNGGRLIGHNTDVYGFQFLLENNFKNLSFSGEVCLLGAGGAARAVSLALSRAGAQRLTIANRTLDRGEELAAFLTASGVFKTKEVRAVALKEDSLGEFLTEMIFLVNALSADPVELGLLPREIPKQRRLRAVIDLRYGLPQSLLAKWARANGLLFVDGLDMLLGQGAKAFEIFTGEEAPLKVMGEALGKK